MLVEKVFELVIIDGVRVIGMEDEIGLLEIGKKVDLLIFNLMFLLKVIFMYNLVFILVYFFSMKNIESVIVDGNIIMEDLKILIVNEEKVLKDV